MSCNLTIQSLTALIAAGVTLDIVNGNCGCGRPFRDHPQASKDRFPGKDY